LQAVAPPTIGFLYLNQGMGPDQTEIIGFARPPLRAIIATMIVDSRLTDAWARLPDYLGSHVLVSLTALAIGLGISLPVAIASRRRPILRGALLAAASVVQTIPGLALLALFYPLLLAMAALSERVFGKGFSALGFLPSVLALALYSMLPVLRNTITGLNGVDARLSEAARVIGVRPWRLLRDIELPLALPVIMAGIRTSAVWVIGTATLSTPIGQTSLGNYIFTGLQTQNWVFVIFGCVAAALLALAVDQLLALIQVGVSRRSGARMALGALGLIALTFSALLPGLARPQASYLIGAKTFTEQYVLAALIQQRLEAAGITAARRPGLGSNVLFDALASNEIDIAVDYSGTLWANRMQRHDVPPREQLLAELSQWLQKSLGIRMLGSLGFENAYALAMARKKAEALNIRSISDLAGHAGSLTAAGDYEIFARPEWTALRNAYGLKFRTQRQMQPEFMYKTVAAGEVDVISAYTSDGQISTYDLTVLADDKHAIPPYDAILLVSRKRADDEKLITALKPLIDSIDVATMREANARVSNGSATTDEVALWLNNETARKR
jgi:osmoprotectant transport system substrate-binding protein/osmoprotectant transport system permease protein